MNSKHCIIRSKGLIFEGSIDDAKDLAEELRNLAEESGADLSKTLNDFVFEIESSYQSFFNLDSDEWDKFNTYKIYYQTPKTFEESMRLTFDHINISSINKTHVFLIEIKARDLNHAYHLMQGEIWSPNGEANEVIKMKGLKHTSMSVGDIIYNCETDEYNIVILDGFKKLIKEIEYDTFMFKKRIQELEEQFEISLGYRQINGAFVNIDVTKELKNGWILTVTHGIQNEVENTVNKFKIYLTKKLNLAEDIEDIQ